MRYIFLLFLLLSPPCAYCRHSGSANRSAIDSLHSLKDIETFIHLADSTFKTFSFISEDVSHLFSSAEERDEFISTRDRLHAPPFARADLDGNGFADMIVTGERDNHYVVLAIMAMDSRHFRVLRMSRHDECNYPLIKKLGREIIVVNYHWVYPNWRREEDFPQYLKADTLVFKWENFIERNPAPVPYPITQIEFKAGPCFLPCEEFVLTINPDCSFLYDGDVLTDQFTTLKYKGHIDSAKYSELVSVLNYADFPRLDTAYSVSYTDARTYYLKITYSNGLTKSIRDYGTRGTYGLQLLYGLLMDMIRPQEWGK